MKEMQQDAIRRLKIPYICLRLLIVMSVVLLFFPSLNPANIITKSGQAKISLSSSLFTCGVSYSGLTAGLSRAFTKGWLLEGHFETLFLLCVLILISIVLMGIGGCMSVGNLKMQNVANKFMLMGGTIQFLASIGIYMVYQLIIGAADTNQITYTFPVGIPVYIVFSLVVLILSLVVSIGMPKADKNEKMQMESQYKLFLMLMPFLVLVFAFSYLPLFSWRYAFYDYSVGGELSSENFVGLKWFKLLIQNETYVTRLLQVLKNTLALSGLGILTSWVPMFFAIFLSEIKSDRFRRFVQIFTTIPNFISWVLVYAIAFSIFSTDGFINTLINNLGGTAAANYLQSADHMWLKMLAWGMWKGVGWSAIIYISGIAGIDQQLYEAATVDGAGRFQKIRHITLPGLLPTFVVMLVMSIAGVLSNGMDQYLVFTNANNKDVIEVLDLYVYNLGIGNGSIPLSTVVGMAKSIVSVGLLFIANGASKLIRGESVV